MAGLTAPPVAAYTAVLMALKKPSAAQMSARPPKTPSGTWVRCSAAIWVLTNSSRVGK